MNLCGSKKNHPRAKMREVWVEWETFFFVCFWFSFVSQEWMFVVQFLGIFHVRHCLCLLRVGINGRMERKTVGSMIQSQLCWVIRQCVVYTLAYYAYYICAYYFDFWKKWSVIWIWVFFWSYYQENLTWYCFMLSLFLNKCDCMKSQQAMKQMESLLLRTLWKSY